MAVLLDRLEVPLDAGSVLVYRTEPGALAVAPALRDFFDEPIGYVTSLNDSTLGPLATLVDGDSEIELVPFGDLARVICRWLGLPAARVAAVGLAEAAIAHCCRVSGRLFRAPARSVGLAKSVSKTLRDLRYAGCTAESLQEIASQAGGALGERIAELASILKQSDAILKTLGREHLSDHLRRVADASQGEWSEVEKPARIFFANIEDLQPLHLAWMKRLAEEGITIGLCVETHASLPDFFAGPLRLLGAAPTKTYSATGLASSLFTNVASPSAEPVVEIAEAADPLSEAEWALRGCHQALVDGASPNEVAIYYRDESYGPLLAGAARRLRIPIRSSIRVPLLSNRLSAFVLALLKALASDDTREMADALASSYAELSPTTKLALSDLTRSTHGEPDAWLRLEKFIENELQDALWVAAIFEWRSEALNENPEEEPDQGPATAEIWFARIRLLIELLPILDARDYDTWAFDQSALKALRGALADEASIRKATGQPRITLAEAVEWCEEVWGRAECTMPQQDEGIQIIRADQGHGGFRKLWILGVVEGRFPAGPTADCILPDLERLQLREYGLHIETSVEAHRLKERETLVRLCALASQSLVISSPRTQNNRECEPSSFVDEVRRAAGNVIERPDLPVFPDREECSLESDLRLREALEREKIEPNPPSLGEQIAARLVVDKDTPVSVGGLREAERCPFRFQAGRQDLINAPVLNFPHRLSRLPEIVKLPLIATEEEARKKLLAALDDELDALKSRVDRWVLRINYLQGVRYINALVTREFEARKIWPRKISAVPAAFTISLPEHEILVRGTVAATGQIWDRPSYHVYRPDADDDAFNVLKLFLNGVATGGGEAGIYEVDMPKSRFTFGDPRLEGSGKYKGLSIPIGVANSLRGMLSRAKRVLRTGKGNAQPNRKNCEHCDYGELCRRSFYFGEQPGFSFESERSDEEDDELQSD